MLSLVILLSLIYLLSSCSCKNNQKLTGKEIIESIKDQLLGADTVPIDRSINPSNAYNKYFLDSNDVKKFMLTNTEFEPYITDMISFYKTRNFQFAWFDDKGLIEQAGNFINILNNSQALQNDSSLIDKKLYTLYKKLNNIDSTKRNANEILEAEIRLTGQFFKFAHSKYEGSSIDAQKLGWFIPRKRIDMNVLFDSTVASSHLTEDKLFMNPIYSHLQEAFIKYSKLKDQPWPEIIISGNKLTSDDSLAVYQVKERLERFGDIDQQDVNDIYDSTLTKAIRSYQYRYGLKISGIPDKTFMQSVNTPLDTLLKRMVINLERAKWMPSQMPDTYCWVNIPEYKLRVYENGSEQFDMNVVVGSQANNTVIFTDIMEYVVFAPYWGVPTSIVKKEIMPALSRGSNYLERNNMEITGYNGSIPVIRQKPGPKNSLGLVKFLFPNAYNIYFHDTPSKWAFSETNRGMSHGCVRLQSPAKFAKWVLRYNAAKYTTAYIDSMMHINKKETYIKLRKEYRPAVYMVYFTAWVNDDGKLIFRKDIYKHDAAMAAKLFK